MTPNECDMTAAALLTRCNSPTAALVPTCMLLLLLEMLPPRSNCHAKISSYNTCWASQPFTAGKAAHTQSKHNAYGGQQACNTMLRNT
jgi:hypothetical protein